MPYSTRRSQSSCLLSVLYNLIIFWLKFLTDLPELPSTATIVVVAAVRELGLLWYPICQRDLLWFANALSALFKQDALISPRTADQNTTGRAYRLRSRSEASNLGSK